MVLSCGCVSSAVAGQVVTVGASADTTLYESATGALSNGLGSGMFAGRTGQSSNSRRRALVAFDIAAALPTGATITSATLRLYQESSSTSERVVSLHRVLEQWGEGTSVAAGNGGSGAPSTSGDATWIHSSFPGTLWSSEGGTFNASPSAVQSVGGVGFWEWSSVQLAADAQAFFDDPSSNFGWLLQGDESASGTAKRFSTRDEASANLRPVLILAYVPSPGAGASALGLVVAIAIRRRRATLPNAD